MCVFGQHRTEAASEGQDGDLTTRGGFHLIPALCSASCLGETLGGQPGPSFRLNSARQDMSSVVPAAGHHPKLMTPASPPPTLPHSGHTGFRSPMKALMKSALN